MRGEGDRGVKIKICGITNLEDALAAVEAGCDALGFVFYKKSPRYIRPQEARGIIKDLPRGIKKVGVFVNAREKDIRRTARICGLDMLQFHGDEPPEFCRRFRGYKVIKAFRVKDSINGEYIGRYKTFAYLLDAFVRGKPGGTGRQFNWELFKSVDRIRRPLFLSGGLNLRNVKRAIRLAHPDWVDVSSSLEVGPGKKDRRKLGKFIKTVKKGN